MVWRHGSGPARADLFWRAEPSSNLHSQRWLANTCTASHPDLQPGGRARCGHTIRNMHYMRSRILQENGKSENIPYFEMPVCPKVKELVGYLRPVHRCAIATFKSILQTGTLDSREVRSSIAEDPYAALEKKVPADSRIYCWMLSFTKDKPVEPLVDWVVASSKQALARIQFQSSEASDRAQRRQSLETLTAAVNQLELEVKYFYGWSQLTSKLSDALNRVVEALPEEVQAALDALISHFRQLLGLPDKHGALWVYLSSPVIWCCHKSSRSSCHDCGKLGKCSKPASSRC